MAWSGHAPYDRATWWLDLARNPCQGADEFLGTQGDPWDTQSDMFMAMVGGVGALSLLAGWQDRQIARLSRAGADSGADSSASVGGIPG
jgi:putative membrane protein